ncbi:MAG: hypothetical protein ABWK01_08830 [Infirmifilum sp.]
MEQGKVDFAVKLILAGSVLLVIGAILAGSVNYKLSMREKIPIRIDLSKEKNMQYPLPPNLSPKAYYNLSYKGERYINVSIIFLNAESSEIGRLTITDAGKNGSGYLYLDDSPRTIVIENNGLETNTVLSFTFYFAKNNDNLVNFESLVSAFLAVIGSVTLLMGGYLYVGYRNQGKTTLALFSQEEHALQQ